MCRKFASLLCVLSLAATAPVSAQDAAETAIILSGTGASQAKASKSLGSAISQSLDSAAGVVRQSSPAPRRSHARRNRRSNAASTVTIIASGDALEGTDASAYQVGSGATIRVSGGFRPSATSRCTENCQGGTSGD